MGCEEEWEEGQDAKSSQAEKSSMFKSSGRLCWKGPGPARLRISRDVTYCWTSGLTLTSDSVSSSQLTWLTANCQEADHKVWE